MRILLGILPRHSWSAERNLLMCGALPPTLNEIFRGRCRNDDDERCASFFVLRWTSSTLAPTGACVGVPHMCVWILTLAVLCLLVYIWQHMLLWKAFGSN